MMEKDDCVAVSSDGTAEPWVFISFSSHDLSTAERVWRELKLRHIPCWISSRHIRPGEDFQQSIVSAMERTKVCVLIFSTHTNDSAEVKKELAIANHLGLAIMPVRIEDTQAGGAMRYQLTNRQYVDLFVDWEEGLARLAAAIRAYRSQKPSAVSPDSQGDQVALPQFSEEDLVQTTDRLALFLVPSHPFWSSRRRHRQRASPTYTSFFPNKSLMTRSG